jgi:hypothetical protein
MKHFTDALFKDMLREEDQVYYHIEVFNENNVYQGGLFRGLKKLLDTLWEADDERYDYINEPLSWLEYNTPYPNNLDDPKIKFAYKQDFYTNYIEYFKDLEAELNELGWLMSTTKLNKPAKIIYEDDVQIAYI